MKKSIYQKKGSVMFIAFLLLLSLVSGIGESKAVVNQKVSPCSSYGDIDDDGYVTYTDRDLVLQYSVGNATFTDEQKILADVNGDGLINSVDSLAIAHYIEGTVGYETFGICSKLKASPCGNYGDIDDDGFVTTLDRDLILNYSVGNVSFTAEQKLRADLDGNGEVVNSVDANVINQYLAGNITIFPICKASPCGNYGDLDDDGYVTYTDRDLVLQYSVGNVTFTDEQKIRADVNDDDLINSVDSLAITHYIEGTVGYETFGVCSSLPDLIIESVRIDAYHNTIVKIKNVGIALYHASYDNTFINWKDLTSGKTGSIKNYRIVNIPAGGSEEFIITKDIIAEGEHNLEITVDPDNVVVESNENNNLSNLSVVISENKLPDLVITGIEVKKVVDPHLGEGIDIVVKVKNIGKGYYVYGDSKVEKFISWSDSISGKSGSIGNYKLISILPGETKEYSIYRTGLDLEFYNVKVIIDPENIIEESNNQNNTFIKNSARSSCLIDGTLIKLPNDPKIYIIINCKRYWVKTAEEFKRKGYRWENVKITTDDELNSLPEDSTPTPTIKEGAIIRAIGDVDIYIVKYIGNKKFKRLILNPSVFRSYGHLRWEDVIEVEKETVDSFTTSNLVRNAMTGKIYRLTANGDNGIKRHFKSVSVMQRLGHDLDAVYAINETDENSYERGEDFE